MTTKTLRRVLAPPQILFLAGLLGLTLIASAFIWWTEVRRQESNARADFERTVDGVFNALSGRLETYQAILRSLSGAWAENPGMGANEWNTLVHRALLETDYPGIDGLALAQPVSASDRQTFSTDIRTRLWRDFAIHPDGIREQSAVITLFAPMSRNGHRAIGYDIASHPARWQAAQIARDSGKTTLTPPLTLITSGGSERSFLLVHPVYGADFPTSTTAQRRKALMGWLLLGLHAQSLVSPISAAITDPLIDIRVSSGDHLIFSDSQDRPATEPLFDSTRFLDFAGLRWTLVAHHHMPWSALWFGAAPLTLLVISMAFSIAATCAAALLLVSREQNRQLALQAMGQLSRTERTLAGVTASVPGTVFQWQIAADGGGQGFSFVSPQAATMFGLSPDLLLEDWRRLPFEPDERADWPHFMMQTALGGSEGQREGRYHTAAGETRWWKGTALPSVGEDGVTVLNGIFIDITDQKDAQRELAERERTYREIFERTSAVKVLIDPQDGQVVDANSAARAYYGYGPDDPLRNTAEVSMQEPRHLHELLARSAQGERQFFRSRHRLNNGEIREVEVHMGPVRMNGRQYVHAIVHDVTDRERYQAELTEKSAKLEMSNAELQQFSYVVSHDLQEPLRTIASFLQLLERRHGDQLQGEAHDFIGFAVDAATRLQAMIQDLLEYSRIGTRGRPFAATAMDQVCAVARANLAHAIAESGASLTIAPLPTIMADDLQMVSLMQNLIGNALKYHRPDIAPEITVSATETPDHWEFSVADNGIGIDPQYFDRIFLVFQRLHTREKFGGTGIGLALCRKIVERHGGQISVQSQPDQGSTFCFTIPKRVTDGSA